MERKQSTTTRFCQTTCGRSKIFLWLHSCKREPKSNISRQRLLRIARLTVYRTFVSLRNLNTYLLLCASKLDKGFSKIYRDSLLRELKHYVLAKKLHLEKLGKIQEAKKIKQLGDLSSIKSFWQYDDRVVARLHGFKNVQDYYQRSSSRQFLKSIAIPTLLIQAVDDPFMTADVLPDLSELSPSIYLEITQGGGHVGFVAGTIPFKPDYWLDHRIPEFLKQYMSPGCDRSD